MALKVKAKERLQKVGKYAGTYRYVMLPELYSALSKDKVIKEAALTAFLTVITTTSCMGHGPITL